MADLELKKKALRLLVTNGVLTDEECEKCIGAITQNDTRVLAPNINSVSLGTGVIYEDENLAVSYKGIHGITNLFFGKGYSIRFIVQNKTSYEMAVSATEISVNGFMIEDDEYIESEVPANRKTVSGANIFQGKLNDCDVYSIDDMETLELRVKYAIKDINVERESDILLLTPYES